ncbi:MAG: RNA polymerase factor sigma-54 [Muribaculaceae bacterium]|nr:RNA polymerase factor sigma-54 [Muribaculaceae bacterium]MDE6795507.1 RNA polymerase factor sigma-54 [Muribaculaceae bacterium]
MASDQSLSLDQRLSMRLSAQQLRFVKLLEFNAPELEEAIDRELEDNPALEALEPAPVTDADIPAYRLNARNYSPDDFSDYDFTPADTSDSLYDYLRRQLSERSVSPKLKEAVDYLIDSLDPNGYLLRPLPSLMNDMAFGPGIELSTAEAVEALNILQSFEPYGVGATDLRDCLMLQLQHLPESQTRDDALSILETQFEAFSMKHSHKIVSALKISQERVKEAINLILTLNPKPGASFDSSTSTNVIVPDLVVTNEDGQLSVALNNKIPELAIDRTFSEAVAEMQSEAKREKKKGSEFVMSRYNDARDFIRVLRQRQETLLNVMTAILKIQKDYFLTEDVYRLKPMMIKDIAALTGYDLSVISRATANKYVATPWGIFPLRFFFSDSIGETSDEGNGESAPEVLTNRKIEAEIEDLVNKEDKKHPLSDEKIKQLMEERGYDVSRRTVAKYRDRKGIPVARLRKEM